MAKPNYLTAQLRESAPYLQDAGWRDTSRLLLIAADEIEQLRARIAELELALEWTPKRRQVS